MPAAGVSDRIDEIKHEYIDSMLHSCQLCLVVSSLCLYYRYVSIALIFCKLGYHPLCWHFPTATNTLWPPLPFSCKHQPLPV